MATHPSNYNRVSCVVPPATASVEQDVDVKMTDATTLNTQRRGSMDSQRRENESGKSTWADQESLYRE